LGVKRALSIVGLSLLAVAVAGGDVTLKYQVTLSPQTAREFLGALALALFFVADDELTWREDDAGRIKIENAGKCLLEIDAEAREVRFFSLFEKRFVPVDPQRAEKIVTVVDFFLGRPLEPGDEMGLDYPLRDKSYRLEARVVSRGAFTLDAWPEEAFPCGRVDGLITGWGDDKQTTVCAYVGSEGELTGKLLKLSFKFTDWPRVTLTLSGRDAN